tara:strand:- start:332 stop:1327 length:996 start_codon:yes stop_codon:yes gene_type:complete
MQVADEIASFLHLLQGFGRLAELMGGSQRLRFERRHSAMITLDALRMLDTTYWLRSGERASQRLHCSQSTVSRNNMESLTLFGLAMERVDGEWQMHGDVNLLMMERLVHQKKRLLGDSVSPPLRVEANFWAAPSLLEPIPKHWEGGTWDHVGMERPLQLLRERVIDAWIASYQPDLPDRDPDLCVIDLCRSPVHLVAAVDHPLAGCGPLSASDLDPFPSLGLPSGMFPQTEAILRGHGLWQTRVRMKRYRPELWHGRTEDQVTLTYATCLALEVMPGLVPLDFNLGLISGESLVVRRDLLEEVVIQDLLQLLIHRCELLAEDFPELEMALT